MCSGRLIILEISMMAPVEMMLYWIKATLGDHGTLQTMKMDKLGWNQKTNQRVCLSMFPAP